MTSDSAEMGFLDHLEELRSRLLRSLLALTVGFAAGLWIVQRIQLVALLKAPIAQYLSSTGGKLAVTSPTDPVLIVLKLGFVVGLVLSSPVIIWQAWAFLAPALYTRERRAVVPSLVVGMLLFLTGGVVGYVYLVPQALRVLFSFQSDALALIITYDEYFNFVLQIVLGLGLSFELPLVIILLSALGVVTPAGLNRFRRFAIVLSMIAGAFLSPGTDLLSMVMMTIPLILLYEVGFFGSWIIDRRRRRVAAAAAAAILLFLALAAAPASAQEPVKRPTKADSLRQANAGRDTLTTVSPSPADSVLAPTVGRARADTGDTTRGAPRPGQMVDTATARRLGLPTAPSHSFAPADSVVDALLVRQGYEVTRYRSDSAVLFAESHTIRLQGEAMTERAGTTLEADSITYQEADCLLRASGNPHLFDGQNVLIGDGIRYNTCIRRGVVEQALTTFQQNGTNWFLRGNLAQDSSSSRLYAGSSEITSCDLPEPHYHFSAKQVKWVSKSVLVARPAVLYVRDVPILWLPFVFEDARPGRRSGILIPQFGLNDLVRPTPGYNRQFTNLGYYWAPSDYFDVTGRLDWYANRYVQYGFNAQYRWLNRFVSGSMGYNRQSQSGGGTATNIRWNHIQNFNLNTSLNLSLNYSSNTSIVRQNAIDPVLSTQQILSSLNFSKRYGWGTLTLGGNRRQNISDKSSTTQFPALTISPKPIDLSRSVTWSPGLSITNELDNNQISPQIVRFLANGLVDTLASTFDQRTTAINFDTPFRFGGFNWRNSFSVTDQQKTGRETVTFKVPDASTADPTDSLTVSQTYTGNFSTALNWDTGINLPVLFRGSWKLQPVLGIANSTSGPFMLRNRNTGGSWVRQGKRFSLTLSTSPTLFGFFPGFGPIARIRHSFSPSVSFNYSPAASVPLDYARAIAAPGSPILLRSDPTETISIGLSQNFEGKDKVAPGDTSATPNVRKFRILGISTSAIAYDFEQAKKPGQNGWRTQVLTNSFQSELLPGFTLSLTHDLWRGQVGIDTSKFDPFLQTVSASFAISGGTVHSLLSAVGLAKKTSKPGEKEEPPPPSYVASQSRRGRPPSFYRSEQLVPGGGGRFTANFNYSLSRSRPTVDATGAVTTLPTRQNLGVSTSFSPTAFWNVSWSAQYNITDKKFESQVFRLERNLHEWKAGFNFVRNANGNVAFFFSIYLTDLPEIKFDYNQTTIER